MSRWIPLFALLLVGCPRQEPPVNSGAVADDRPAYLGVDRAEAQRHVRTLERKLALLSTVEGPAAAASQRRLEAARELLDALAAPEGAAPRDQERSALAAFAAYLDRVLHAEPTPEPSGATAEPIAPLARASEAARAGDYAGALEAGEDGREDLFAVSADSVSLLEVLADWAIQAGEPELALDYLADAIDVATAQEGQVEVLESLRAQAQEDLLGPAAAALERGRRLRAADDLPGAADAFRDALSHAGGEDPSAVSAARDELASLVEVAAARATDLLRRVDVLLAGEGPWDHAGALLDEVSSLPPEAVDDAELLRLRAWYRGLTSEQDRARVEADRAELDARLQEARDLVAGGKYRDAVTAYRSLEGTPKQATARQEAKGAIDTLVRAERERAGRMFVAARKRSGAERIAALQEVRDLLAGLLQEFPESSYASRVAENLAAVDRELES